MASSINTIRLKLIAKVQDKYPQITAEQIDDELDYYFKHVKSEVVALKKPEITVGIVGRITIIYSELKSNIKRITTTLKNPNLVGWRKDFLERKLEQLNKVNEVKQDVYRQGKTYKSTRRKRLDGRVQPDV